MVICISTYCILNTYRVLCNSVLSFKRSCAYKIIGLTDRRTGQKLYTLHNSVAWGIIKELVLDQFFFVCKLCLEVDFLLYRFVWIGFHWYHCIYTFIYFIIQKGQLGDRESYWYNTSKICISSSHIRHQKKQVPDLRRCVYMVACKGIKTYLFSGHMLQKAKYKTQKADKADQT